jgi:ATP-binding cassette subfamily B protein
MRDLANTTFKKLTLHSYEFFAHTFVGSLVSNTNKLVRSYETVGDFLVYNLFSEGSRLVISAAILFYFSTALGLIYLALIIAYASLYFFQIRERLTADNERNDAESATTGTLADALTNILTIKTFAQTKSERQHFGHYVDKEYDARHGVWQLGNVQRGIQRGMLTAFELFALGMALYLWHAGAITAGTIVLLQLYLLSAMDTVFNLSRNLTKTVSAISDASVMAKILEQPLSVTDPTRPEPSRMQTGAIAIQDMSFAYEGTNEVFTKFNLTIPAGQKVGLVGHSGSGKTTITKLLLRFIDVQAGCITIDGQDIRAIAQDDLRRAIAYVPQEPLLFHRTIGERAVPPAIADDFGASSQARQKH